MNDLYILHLETDLMKLPPAFRQHGIQILISVTEVDRSFPQHCRQLGGHEALSRSEILIARTGCHTIDLSHRGAAPHAHRQTEVSHHPTQDGELLPVLFSQPKLIRTHQGQQTADDGDHAIEVARSPGSAEPCLQR